MGNATVSSSAKTDSGTLHSLGGDGWDDYYQNLLGLFDGNLNDAVAVTEEFRNSVRPVRGYAYGSSSPAPRSEPEQHGSRGDAGSPPGNTLCPSHQQPAKYIKSAKGEFWKCPINETFINNYGSSGFRTACPAPK